MFMYDKDMQQDCHITKEAIERGDLKKLYLENYGDWLMHKYKEEKNEQKKIPENKTESEYTLSGLSVRLWIPFFTCIVLFFICVCLFLLIVS